MAQSKVQTNDVTTRHDFKANLADKVATSLVPTVNQGAPIVEPVQVTIPVNFHTMSKYHLFGYLTHEAGLTLEQANDVIDQLIDNKISNTQFNITLQGVHALKELEAECILPEPPKTVKIELPYNFNSLRVQDRFLWLMKESHLALSHSEANDVIDIAQGKVNQVTDTQFTLTYQEPPTLDPQTTQAFSHSVVDEIPERSRLTHFDVPELPEGFELKTRIEQYRVLTDEVKLTPEHARFVLDTLQVPIPAPAVVAEPEPTILNVSLPYAFRGWVHKDQFAFLTKIKHLSTSEAEDVLGHYDGRQTLSVVTIDWEDVVDPEGRSNFKSQLLSRIKKAKVKEPTPVQAFSIPELPEGFETLTGNEQFRLLLDLKLTPEHAQFVMASLVPTPEAGKTETKPVLRQEIISVSLPHAFKAWNDSDRFAFLTRNRHLSTSKAEDVLAHYDGQQQLSAVFIDWEDVVDPEGRQSFKSQLAERIKNAKNVEMASIKQLPMPDLPEEFTLWAGIDQFRYLTISLALVPEHAHLILNSLEKPKVVVEETQELESRVLSVSVPLAFNNWNVSDRFEFLTRIKQLPTSDANDVLAYFNGENTLIPVEVSWEDLVDPAGRTKFKADLAERAQKAKVVEPKPVFNVRKARREIESVEDISSFTTSQPELIDITLPIGFNEFKPFDQHLYLTRTLKLPIDLADSLLAGDPVFNITYASAEEAENTVPNVPVSALPVLIGKKASKKSKVFVSLPPAFNSLSTGEQYWYLVKTKELSYAEANDCLASLNNKPQTGNVEFVVDWEE